MEIIKKTDKEIVYWGIGSICKMCIEHYPENVPSFFIDSNPGKRSFVGKEVKLPNEIINWWQYYIVITIKSSRASAEVQKYLERIGLRKDEDFCTYEEVFLCSNPTIQVSINLVDTYITKHPEVINPIMLVVPLVSHRSGKNLRRFFSNYIKKRGHNKCVIFSNLQVITSEIASERLKCPVFYIPDTNSSIRGDDIDMETARGIKEKLLEQEINWIEDMEDKKSSPNKEQSIYESAEIYYYYKAVIERIKPSKIIIWGNWSRESYILGHLSSCYNIPCGYMEYGWIPGTFQVDPRGIAGQSEYAVNLHMFDKSVIENIYNIEQIKQYVINKKLDNRTFVDTEEDNAALFRVKENMKNVFLVGMDDYGMQMNPKNGYWKKHISNIVESTEQALFLLSKLCKKNKWNLIFKPHPGNLVPNLGKDMEDVIIVRNMEIDRLIRLSDVVISISSAVEYKALIYGKPLVQLGITGLLGKGCTYVVTEKQMLEQQMISALNNGMTQKQKENFDRFLQILLQRYLWDDLSERSLRYGLTVEQDFLE